MPPPYAQWRYRGYDLVQWDERGPVEISDGLEYLVTEKDVAAAERVIDDWKISV